MTVHVCVELTYAVTSHAMAPEENWFYDRTHLEELKSVWKMTSKLCCGCTAAESEWPH